MATDPANDAPKAETIGPYRLQKPLGSGGMGVVWSAWDERLKRAVALKRFHTESARVTNLRERFRREAQAVARLSHPAIVHIYDILEMEDADWIVMELVQGRTLRDLLDAEGPLDPASAVRIGREVAEGLAEAHAHGILHRDLKASNVMVTPSGRVKILDFGLAKDVAGGAGFDVTISAPGMILGTSHAMSPEQAMGQPLDGRSDLFSLGSLIYEALTGAPPFLADNPLASLGRVLHIRQQPLHEILPLVPQPLSALVDRLLEKDANLRPQSAREVADALAALEATGQLRTGESLESHTGLFGGFDSQATFDIGPRIAPRKDRQRRLGERRLLTVVCCGLVGLDRVSGQTETIEIEVLSEAMAALQDLAKEACERLGGRMGGVLGQLLWLYFGYPQAHEDDAQRAVRAAREIAHRSEEPGPALGSSQRLAVRVTLHSGPAVAIRTDQDEQLQPGATLDLALAMQSAAPAGGVVVSAESRKLIEESFILEPLEPVRLPGFAEPLPIHRVLGIADPRDRESAAIAPLVGRERELELLLDRFRQARSGNGQMVMISGEPGIGKSHLVRAFRERLLESGDDLLWLVGHGSPYTQGSPLFPVIGLLERALFQPDSETPDRKLSRLEEILRHYQFPLEESVPLFAALLSLPANGRYPPPALGPDVQRKKTLEAVVALFAEMAERHPMVLVIEDLHWVDPSTLELLGLLLDAIPALRLTLLVTFRPDFEAPWSHRAQIVQLGLSRLADRETEALIDRVAGGKDLPPDVRQQIVEKTDGVPLFIEELTKTVLESGKSGAELDIPSTLSGSLMARLDRLGTAREVAQVASVIGRTFSFDLLAEVSPLDPDTLHQCLGELLEAELVYRRGLAQRERYIFKHALVQDTAYASLLKKDRQRLHRQIAAALEGRLSEPDAAQPEVIAQHYTAGEEIGKAVDFWLEAGQRAGARFAHVEAIDHLRQGLRVLASLPPGLERDQRELALQGALGPPLAMTRGHAAPEVEATYARLLELSDRTGNPPQGIYFGLWNIYASRGELRRARDLAQQRIQAAEETQDLESLVLGLYTRAAADQYLGDLKSSQATFERLFAVHPRASVGTSNDYDIRTTALASWADSQWLVGHPDLALRTCNEAVELSRALSPRALSVTLLIKLILLTSMRDREGTLTASQELLALSRKHSYEFWTVFCDLSEAVMGTGPSASPAEVDKALETAIRAVEIMHTIHGNQLQRTRYLAWIVELCLSHGRRDQARQLLDEAFAAVEKTDERYWEAELYRLRGLLLLAEDASAAEVSLEKALGLARERGERIFELRAAGDIARLRDGQGRRAKAGQLLLGVYDSFTEGWATPDLTEARDLLAALGALT